VPGQKNPSPPVPRNEIPLQAFPVKYVSEATLIFDFYRNLLGESLEREVTVNLAELKRPNLDLTELDAPFAEEEVWKSINSLPSCKALGPDSFNGKFYRVYWQIIKVNVMAAISAV